MSRVVRRRTVDEQHLDRLLTPRNDLVAELEVAPGVFEAAEGPFRRYRRTVEVVARHDGTVDVTQTVDVRLAIPYFGFLFARPVRAALQRPPRRAPPWWAPPQRLDARAAAVLGTVCAASLLVGYQNTLLTQTIAFAADEFDAGDRAQGVALAVARTGIVVALVLTSLADRRGRRAVIVLTALAGPVLAATGALAPSLAWLTASQFAARPLAIALGIALGITAAEEMPAGGRAYAISVLSMSTALGAGICVMALPLAGLGASGWRLLYLVPLAGLPLAVSVARRIPESRRFDAPHRAATLRSHGRRFWLLAAAGLLLNLFVAPASSFQNRYLRAERGFSAGRIALFTLVTNTPGGIGVVLGGRLADLRGRRVVGAVALVGGSVATAAAFWLAGASLWLVSIVGGVVGAAAVPALGVYGAELFPTSLRGRANGIIAVLALVGSGVGLLAAGSMAEGFGTFGPAMAVLAVGPLLLAGLVLAAFPETAHLELEQLNPEDRPPPAAPPPVRP
ncbi:MAG: MFS transporter [Acidimicrobiales bacterium]|nr:MFS transporter [Acidimicrobiales bacterium]